MPLVKAGRAVADDWQNLEDEAPVPKSGRITVSWKRWLVERGVLAGRSASLGVRVSNTIAGAEIGADIANFSLVALSFPNFGDGRAYSQARILRGRFGFKGELRATGAVLRDQLLFMHRCGIDAFDVSDRAIAENWFAALGEFDLFYQPGEDNRPWIMRQRLRSAPAP